MSWLREKPAMKDILHKAIETEEMGTRFYSEHAVKSTNPLVKSLLAELASDEEKHAECFRGLLNQVESGKPVSYIESPDTEIEARIKAVFGKMDASMKSGSTKEQEDVLKMAMALEKESFAVYDGLFQKADDDEERKLFDRLRREEYGHLTALENILMYLTKTGMWFDIEESKRWNWMV